MRATLRRIGITVGTILLSLLIIGIAWQLVISLSGANPYISRTPVGVWDFLFGGAKLPPAAIKDREALPEMIGITLLHALWGFVGGVGASVIIACAFTLVRPLEFMFMPIAMLLRTVPLLAMAPVIYLVLGNGWLTAAFIGGVVVFFPILVNVTLGLRSVAQQQVDLITVYGGNRFTVFRKVAFPHALPHFFASMRIAVPGAITGAMLYEWLFTLQYEGLGAGINTATAHFDYGLIWAIVVIVTLMSILFYTIAAVVEQLVLQRWGPNAGRVADA